MMLQLQDRPTTGVRPARSNNPLASLLALALLLPGCTVLAPRPDTSRHFVLAAAAPAATETLRNASLHLGIGPVTMPAYLETQQLIRRREGAALEFIADAWWAEPLSKGLPRALAEQVAERLGTTMVSSWPWYDTAGVQWQAAVDVLRMEADGTDRAVLVARWKIVDASTGRTVASARSSFEEAAGSDAADVASALGRCVDRLSETLAAAIAKAATRTSAPSVAGATRAGD
jgi:uncharacterized lipoprotein YmbA